MRRLTNLHSEICFSFWVKTRTVLDRFHDSSRVVLLICLKLPCVLKAEKVWESVPKAEKYAKSMRKFADCYFCTIPVLFFAVQMLFFAVHTIFFWCALQIFCCGEKNWVSSTNFCRLLELFCCLIEQVLLCLAVLS